MTAPTTAPPTSIAAPTVAPTTSPATPIAAVARQPASIGAINKNRISFFIGRPASSAATVRAPVRPRKLAMQSFLNAEARVEVEFFAAIISGAAKGAGIVRRLSTPAIGSEKIFRAHEQ